MKSKGPRPMKSLQYIMTEAWPFNEPLIPVAVSKCPTQIRCLMGLNTIPHNGSDRTIMISEILYGSLPFEV